MDSVIDAFYRAYNAHDAAAAVALYAPEGSHAEAASGQSRQGANALEKGLRGFFGMLKDLRFEERERIRAGGSMLVTYVMHGVMARDLGPMRARGQAIALPGAHLFEIADGRILRTVDYWDPAEFKRQVAA